MYNLKKQKIVYLFGAITLLTGLITMPVQADIAVITNPGGGVATANSSDIKALFLNKSKTVAGKHLTPIEQKSGDVRGTFNNKVLGKSDSQLKSYWTKLLFSGKGSPPKSFGNDAAVKAYVAANANAIGYIDSSAADASVKVILTVK